MGHSSGIYHPLAMGNVVKKNRGSDGNSCPNQKYEYNPAIIADHGLNYIYNIYISERVFFWDDASNPKRHLWYLGHQNSWDHYRHDHAISKIKTSLNQPEIYVF
jgi:hypothetical protein